MDQLHQEDTRLKHSGWLRAAVLGANDGIISTASLIIGVASAHPIHSAIVIAAVAGLIAGAMSMAAGEYISVSSQADTEKSEIHREQHHIKDNLPQEIACLKDTYIKRGLEPELADKVAQQLMAHDAIGALSRDTLGITETLSAKPFQAAIASACCFTAGAALPVLVVLLSTTAVLIPVLSFFTVIFLALLGMLAAKMGGCKVIRGAIRVAIWGSLALGVSAGIGRLLGIAV